MGKSGTVSTGVQSEYVPRDGVGRCVLVPKLLREVRGFERTRREARGVDGLCTKQIVGQLRVDDRRNRPGGPEKKEKRQCLEWGSCEGTWDEHERRGEREEIMVSSTRTDRGR